MQAERLDEDLQILKSENDTTHVTRKQREMAPDRVQFHFCLEGYCVFGFNQGNYRLDLNPQQSLLLYNPQHSLPLDIELQPGARILSLAISIRKFHALFTQEAAIIPFLSEEYKSRKYYQQQAVDPVISVVLSQLWEHQSTGFANNLYARAKVYEVLALFFDRRNNAAIAQCPFLADEDNLVKIRQAKEIMISRMTEPPSLQELSSEVGLGLKKLKEGFKQVYGTTVYNFLVDVKMETAKKLLDTGKYNVNEVGLKIGYSTASHFIVAFRKKYGTTPKQYLLSLARLKV